LKKKKLILLFQNKKEGKRGNQFSLSRRREREDPHLNPPPPTEGED